MAYIRYGCTAWWRALALLVGVAALVAGCGSSDPPKLTGTPWQAHEVLGSVQKGPFIRGTTLLLQELDASLNPMGRSFTFEVNDDLGHFSLPTNVSSRYVEIVATGYYFDELTNQLSKSQLTLRTLSDLSAVSVANANLLTTLAAPRERNLVANGQSFESARAQAEREVLQVLNFGASTSAFDQLDISQAGDTNGLLLAASVLLEKLAYTRSATSPVAELSQAVASIASDIAPDGVYDDAVTSGALKCLLPAQIDQAAVRDNLQSRFDAFGANNVVPAFEQYLVVAPSCCSLDSRRCSGNAVQVCNEVAQWITEDCAGSTPNCKDGYCEAACVANERRCAGKVAQVCDASGSWQDNGQCSWSQPVQLDSDYPEVAQVVVDDAGNALASWSHQGSAARNYSRGLRAAQYAVGTGWGQSTSIELPEGADVDSFALAIQPTGVQTVIWAQSAPIRPSTEATTHLWARQFSPQTGWQPEPHLLDGNGYGLRLTLVGSRLMAAWTEVTSYDPYAFSQVPRVAILDPNSGWLPAVDFDSNHNGGGIEIATNASGDAVAVWYREADDIVASQTDANGNWTTPTILNPHRLTTGGGLAGTGIDVNGNAIAIWSVSNDDKWSIDYALYEPGQGWGVSSEAFRIFGGDVTAKFDNKGNAFVLWQDSAYWQMASRYIRGRGWDTGVSIQSSSQSAYSATLVFDTHGRATAVWLESSISGATQIWLNRFTPGSGWAQAECIVPNGEFYLPGPPGPIAVDKMGRVTLVWIQRGEENHGTWSMRFE